MRSLSTLAFAVLIACGGAQVREVQPDPAQQQEVEDVAAAIESAVTQYKKTYEERALEPIVALYESGSGASLVYQGKLYSGQSQISESISKRLSAATKLRITITDLRVRVLSSTTAMASSELEITIGDDSVSVTEKGLLSLVYRKEGEVWRIALEHFSYPVSR